MELYQLTQLIDSPTRITNSSQSLLDVAITSTPEKIISSGVVHLGISDHSLIYAIRKLNTRVNTKAQAIIFSSLEISKILMLQDFWMICMMYLGKI